MLLRGALAGTILLLAAVGSPAFADHGRATTWSGSVFIDGSKPVRDFKPGHGFDHSWHDWRSKRTSHWFQGRRHHRIHPQTVILLPPHRHSGSALLRSWSGAHLLRPHSKLPVVVIDRRFHCCVKIVVAPGKLPHGFVHGHGHAPTVIVVLPSRKPTRIVVLD